MPATKKPRAHLSAVPPSAEARLSALEAQFIAHKQTVETLAAKVHALEKTLTEELAKMRSSFEDVARTSKQVEERSIRAENMLLEMHRQQVSMAREVTANGTELTGMRSTLDLIAAKILG